MPSAAPFKDPYMLRALFRYDPDTGHLTHNPAPYAAKIVGAPVIRRTNNIQYRFEGYARSHHRIIWAMHHPENPNPKYIVFLDGDKTNTRIENLMGVNTHPRWHGHTKKSTEPMKLLPNGRYVHKDRYADALAEYQATHEHTGEERRARIRASLTLQRRKLTDPTMPDIDTAKVLQELEDLSKPDPAPKPQPLSDILDDWES